jgi:hypothetical protein
MDKVIKAHVYSDEYYPFIFVNETESDGYDVCEVPKELFQKYTKLRTELDKCFEELIKLRKAKIHA